MIHIYFEIRNQKYVHTLGSQNRSKFPKLVAKQAHCCEGIIVFSNGI
jgi:hypothetical protein